MSYYAFFQEWLLPSPPFGCPYSIILFLTYFFIKDLNWRSGLFPFCPWTFAPRDWLFYFKILCFRSFLEFGSIKNTPHPLSALHHNTLIKGFTSIDFAENQLSPSLISLSPLYTSHLRLLPQAWVQPSMVYYDKFQLAHV